MTLLKKALPLATAVALSLAMLPALADSTSSAASSASTSMGSSSASLGKSSDSSSSKERVAQGDYTIVDMVAVDDQPDMLRLRLEAVAASTAPDQAPAQARARPEPFFLMLPRAAAERAQLAAGQTVSALHRPYGLAFVAANAAGHAGPFFLVLDDAWHRELESRPVGV
jgi:hypothetical protein